MRQGWIAILIGALLALTACVPAGGGGGGGDGDGQNGGEQNGGENQPPEMMEPPPPELIEGLVAIEVTMRPDYDLVVGLPRDFRAEGRYEGGETKDLTGDVIWTSSDPSVLSFDDPANPGRAMVHAERRAALIVTATLGEVGGRLTIGDGCDYPAFTSNIVTGATMPALEWDQARLPDGSRGRFSLRDIYCGEAEGEAPAVFVFILGANWCGACTHHMGQLAPDAAALREAGGQFVFVGVENLDYEPASTDESLQTLRGAVGQAPVYVVGDGDAGGVIAGSGAFTSLPSVVVVRTRDMRVIADNATGAAGLDFFAVATDPDAGWDDPPPPMIDNRCAPGDEEDLEPNNTPDTPAVIGDGTIRGGVCDEHPDFYLVDVDGPWRLTLEFSHAVGNLDVYAWDGDDDAPLRVDNRVVGSYSTDDGEVVEHAGPTLIRIGGFRYESAPYLLTVEAL